MKVILLAAGKGTRMKMDLPKVLARFKEKALIEHALDSILASGVDDSPIVVTGYKQEMVKEAIAHYPVQTVYQEEQLGTAHAVQVAREVIDPQENVMVLYGDCALVKPETLKELADLFETKQPAMALVTYKIPHFEVYNGAFKAFGRILRNAEGQVHAIREMKDCNEEELAIPEVNPAFYAFSGKWLWEHIDKIEPKNAQGEYYLTDLLQMAVESNNLVESIHGTDLTEAIGINTIEQLTFVEDLVE